MIFTYLDNNVIAQESRAIVCPPLHPRQNK